MRDFAELLQPFDIERFMTDHHDRAPLHVPATDGIDKRRILNWDRFAGLLNQSQIWTAATLKLVRNGVAVPPDDYCRVVRGQSGVRTQPDPAKVAVFMAEGASVVAGDVQTLTPELAEVADMLGRRFAAAIGANLYCSFQGVQAFDSHYDLHHVFVVQLEGEKLWRLYANRADNPVDFPPDTPENRAWLKNSRGPVIREVRMRPGDVLYLPRGWYHDALATDGPSLHVTFSVTPLYGRVLFGLLEQAALQDPSFREYFVPSSEATRLKQQLRGLGEHLARLCASEAFFDEIAMTQERLRLRPGAISLPQPASLTVYRTGRGPWPVFSGPVSHAMGWAMGQNSFALERLIALFDFVTEADIRAAVDQAVASGALARDAAA
jgi:hypothetical protein